MKKVTRWDLKRIYKTHPNIHHYGYKNYPNKIMKDGVEYSERVSFEDFKFCVEYLRNNIFTWIDSVTTFKTMDADLTELQISIKLDTRRDFTYGPIIAALIFLEIPISCYDWKDPRLIKFYVRDKVYYDLFIPF